MPVTPLLLPSLLLSFGKPLLQSGVRAGKALCNIAERNGVDTFGLEVLQDLKKVRWCFALKCGARHRLIGQLLIRALAISLDLVRGMAIDGEDKRAVDCSIMPALCHLAVCDPCQLISCGQGPESYPGCYLQASPFILLLPLDCGHTRRKPGKLEQTRARERQKR